MYYQQHINRNPFGNWKDFFRGKDALSVMVLINIAVFVLVSLSRLFAFLYQTQSAGDPVHEPVSLLTQWLAVPASVPTLLQRPWTLFSYMFLHEGFMHIFFNMLMLYFGGRLFMEYLGGKKLITTYLIGGLSGALFYIIAFNIFPVFGELLNDSYALGASASVLAILVAVATFVPDYTVNFMFIGRVKMKYIALVLVLMDLLSIERSNPGGHIAHLGGALWGFIYIIALKKNSDPGKIFARVRNFFRGILAPRPRMKVHYSKRPMTDDQYSAGKVAKQQKIDAILDKISKSGYDSLSKDEKDALFNSSKRD